VISGSSDLKFEHKDNPEILTTLVSDHTSDCNDNYEVQAPAEDLSQPIGHEAGTNTKKRADYDHEETDWIIKYFEPEDRKGYQGAAFWATMSKKMNEKFKGTNAVLKDGEKSTSTRQHRKPNALLSKCTRDVSIMAVRGRVICPKRASKRTAREAAEKIVTMADGNNDTTVSPETYSLRDLKKGMGKYGAGEGYGSDSSDKENIPPN
jgi:hypothetical protein